MRQVVSRHHHDLRSVGRVNMPGFQTKVLVVHGLVVIILELSFSIVWLVRHVSSDKAKFSFFTKEGRFLMLFQMCTKLTFGLSYIPVIAVIAQNRIKSVLVSCSFVFLSNINVVAIQNSLHRFRNTVNVRNNSKTSCWFLLIRSIICCNFIP